VYDWAYCELADLDGAEYAPEQTSLWTRGLLIRRSLAGGDLAFFATAKNIGVRPGPGSKPWW
jgi:SRSO17 transposase